MRIAFLGLGPGQKIVRRLIQNKFIVTVWNRTPAACEPLRHIGAVPAALVHEVMDESMSQTLIFKCFSDAMLKPEDEQGPFVWQGMQILRYFLDLSNQYEIGTPVLETLNSNLRSLSEAGHDNEGFASTLHLKRRVNRSHYVPYAP